MAKKKKKSKERKRNDVPNYIFQEIRVEDLKKTNEKY